jgi:hypothetical protein
MTEKCSIRAGPSGPLSPPIGTSWSWSTNDAVFYSLLSFLFFWSVVSRIDAIVLDEIQGVAWNLPLGFLHDYQSVH